MRQEKGGCFLRVVVTFFIHPQYRDRKRILAALDWLRESHPLATLCIRRGRGIQEWTEAHARAKGIDIVTQAPFRGNKVDAIKGWEECIRKMVGLANRVFLFLPSPNMRMRSTEMLAMRLCRDWHKPLVHVFERAGALQRTVQMFPGTEWEKRV